MQRGELAESGTAPPVLSDVRNALPDRGPNAAQDEAVRIADRVRLAVAAEFQDYPVGLTASCGLACTSELLDGKPGLFRAADAALYAAKRAGRDCTVAFDGRIETLEPVE
jgi:PleD family two-component response regulator